MRGRAWQEGTTMADDDFTDSLAPGAGDALVLSRRQALSAAALLATAGTASAQAAAGAPGANVGIAPSPANAVEFRAHFTQTGPTGENFDAYGYLTRVAGASDAELFSGGPLGESTALFTAYAQGSLTNRVHDATGVHRSEERRVGKEC